MQIHINGEAKEISSGLTLLAYLTQSGLDPATVVVERNAQIVPAESFATVVLTAGDSLEILHFVGGG